MNPIIAAAIAQGVAALVAIWREHNNKPPGWTPTPEDWAELDAWADRTPEQMKAEAAARLGK